MTKDEALDLALEALEASEYYINDLEAIVYAADDLGADEDRAKMQEAMTVIKQARSAQPEPNGWAISYDGKTPYAIWPEGDGPLLDLEVKRQGGTCCKLPIYTTPPVQPAPVQEPSGFFRYEDVCGDEVGRPTPYYLTPPAAQRQWVGLAETDKHKPDMGAYVYLNDDWLDGYKTGMEYAEAKLKEKNNG